MKTSITSAVIPLASPSRPSVRLTAFVAPRTIRNTSAYQPAPRSTWKSKIGTNTSVETFSWYATIEMIVATPIWPSSFQRPFSPSDRLRTTFSQSSANPITAHPSSAANTARLFECGAAWYSPPRANSRNDSEAATTIRSPPMVGVPCFVLWCSGPSSRMFWP